MTGRNAAGSGSARVEFRPLAPEDVVRSVEIHLLAFPGFFLSFLGPRFLRLFYGEAIALGEIAFAGEVDGKVAGFVMGSTRPGGFYKLLLRRRLVGFALAAAPAVLRRPGIALRVGRALAKPGEAVRSEGTATLMSIAVDPGVQGVGLGKGLVLAFIEEAARRGASKVDLTTDRDANERTNAFYRSLGFRVARELTTPEGRVMNEYEFDLPHG